MAFALPYPTLISGGNPRPGLRNRRQRRHGIVIFLKTPSRLSGVRLMQQLETGARGIAGGGCHNPRLGLRGAMYDTVEAFWSAPALSLLGPCLLLAISSKRMRGGTLVQAVLESRLIFGGVFLGSDAVRKPCAPSSRHSWLEIEQGGLFIIGFV
jgi:hypothetical protein